METSWSTGLDGGVLFKNAKSGRFNSEVFGDDEGLKFNVKKPVSLRWDEIKFISYQLTGTPKKPFHSLTVCSSKGDYWYLEILNPSEREVHVLNLVQRKYVDLFVNQQEPGPPLEMMVEYVDDWPIMVPKEQEKDLVTRGLAILLQGGNLELGLAQNEKILGIVFGRFRQAVVATDLRVIISKGGWLGADGGRKVSSFEYRSINGIQILHGAPASVPWANHGGTFQILSSSMSSDNSHALNPIVDKIPLFTGVREAVREAPNAVAFRKEHKEEFQNMSNKIREKINSLHLGGDSQSDAKIPEQIKQLSELRDLAIISEEEFEVKKKQLLDRM